VRVHKVVNRVYHGTVYYRWIISVPPKRVRDLGWVDGQRLEIFVQGSSLTLQPSRGVPVQRSGARAEALREVALERSPMRPVPRIRVS
jgi:hypothetical protein